MIEADRASLKPDDIVAFILPGNHPVSGKVAWLRDSCAGIVFEKPLHDAIVKHIGFRPRAEPHEVFKDQFGRTSPSLTPNSKGPDA